MLSALAVRTEVESLLFEWTTFDTPTTLPRWDVYCAGTGKTAVVRDVCAIAAHASVAAVKHW